MRTVFFGTPEIAVPALKALTRTTDVVAVVCQPDRPAGRKLVLRPCAVKLAAEQLGLPVHQPSRVKTGNLDEWLKDRGTNLAVVLAYGRILPPSVLCAPTYGCVNLHASLLPKYRGAAPIQRAIQNGEVETGVSLMRMEEGLDTGPVYAMRQLAIEPVWNSLDLTIRLGEVCAEMIEHDLVRVVRGETPVPQDDHRATLAPPIRAEETRIDWSAPAKHIHDTVRAFAPDPGAHTQCRGKRLRLLQTRVLPQNDGSPPGTASEPGQVVAARGADLWVQTGVGVLALELAQLEGKRALPARDLVNGRAVTMDDRLL